MQVVITVTVFSLELRLMVFSYCLIIVAAVLPATPKVLIIAIIDHSCFPFLLWFLCNLKYLAHFW